MEPGEIKDRALRVARLGGNESDVELERFECGYYDAGQSTRSTKIPLQPACFHFYSTRTKAENEKGNTGYLTTAYFDAVPAGSEIFPDDKWDTAISLLGGPDSVPERGKVSESSPVAEGWGRGDTGIQ